MKNKNLNEMSNEELWQLFPIILSAQAYGELKVKLQKEYEHDRDGYTDAKTGFIREITNRAKEQV